MNIQDFAKTIKEMPLYLQGIIHDVQKKTPLTYTAALVDHVSYWAIASYAQVRTAQGNQELLVFPDNKYLLDRTKDKVGGIAEDYPTFKGHKIFYRVEDRIFVIRKTARTESFEFIDGGGPECQKIARTEEFEFIDSGEPKYCMIIEYYKAGSQSTLRVFRIFNEISETVISGKRELCYVAQLKLKKTILASASTN